MNILCRTVARTSNDRYAQRLVTRKSLVQEPGIISHAMAVASEWSSGAEPTIAPDCRMYVQVRMKDRLDFHGLGPILRGRMCFLRPVIQPLLERMPDDPLQMVKLVERDTKYCQFLVGISMSRAGSHRQNFQQMSFMQ